MIKTTDVKRYLREIGVDVKKYLRENEIDVKKISVRCKLEGMYSIKIHVILKDMMFNEKLISDLLTSRYECMNKQEFYPGKILLENRNKYVHVYYDARVEREYVRYLKHKYKDALNELDVNNRLKVNNGRYELYTHTKDGEYYKIYLKDINKNHILDENWNYKPYIQRLALMFLWEMEKLMYSTNKLKEIA